MVRCHFCSTIAFPSSFKQGFPKNAIRNVCACIDLEFLWSHKAGALNSRCMLPAMLGGMQPPLPGWRTHPAHPQALHTLPDALPCHFLFPASQNPSRMIQALFLRALSVGVSVCSFTTRIVPISLARNSGNWAALVEAALFPAQLCHLSYHPFHRCGKSQ